MSEVGAVGEQRPSARLGAGQAVSPEELGDELDASAGDTLEHRLHGRLLGGRQQRELDPVARGQFRDPLEQEPELLEWIARRGIDLRDHRGGVRSLPVGECGLDERFAAGEVPVEAALGRVEALGERRDRDRREAAFGDRLQCRLGPRFPAQSSPRPSLHLTIPYGTAYHTEGYGAWTDRPARR